MADGGFQLQGGDEGTVMKAHGQTLGKGLANMQLEAIKNVIDQHKQYAQSLQQQPQNGGQPQGGDQAGGQPQGAPDISGDPAMQREDQQLKQLDENLQKHPFMRALAAVLSGGKSEEMYQQRRQSIMNEGATREQLAIAKSSAESKKVMAEMKAQNENLRTMVQFFKAQMPHTQMMQDAQGNWGMYDKNTGRQLFNFPKGFKPPVEVMFGERAATVTAGQQFTEGQTDIRGTVKSMQKLSEDYEKGDLKPEDADRQYGQYRQHLQELGVPEKELAKFPTKFPRSKTIRERLVGLMNDLSERYAAAEGKATGGGQPPKTGGPEPSSADVLKRLPKGSRDNGDGSYTLPDGRKVRPKKAS